MKPFIVTAVGLLSAILPLSASTPMNLARWQTGATLIVKNPANDSYLPVSPLSQGFENSRQAALFSDDPTQGFRLERGTTEIVIDLGMVRTVSEFGFQSFSAGTQCQVSASMGRPSASSTSWRGMGQFTVSPGASASFTSAPVQARYLKLTFTTDTPGQISSLFLTGTEQAKTSRVQRPSRLADQDRPGQPGMLAVDLASVSQGARLISSSGLAEGANPADLNDQNPLSSLEFQANKPAVLVFDLGADSDVDAVGISHNGFKGAMEVYFLSEKLPEGVFLTQENGVSTLSVSKGFFLNGKPDAVLSIAPDDFRSRKSFAPKAARYMVAQVRFEDSLSSPRIGGLSILGHRSPGRVVPLLMASSPVILTPGATSGGVVGVAAGDAPRRASVVAPLPVSARQPDVPVNAAVWITPE